MSTSTRSLIAPTSNALLERALRDKLQRRAETAGSLGELEPLAVRIGLIQNTLKPRFIEPQLVLFASDHGLAVEGPPTPPGHGTAERAMQALTGQLPVAVFARIQGLTLSVVDGGVAERLAPHERLLMRKIAHGTRNSRVGAAMTIDQAQAAIRAGMEIGDSLHGNVLACAAVAVGGYESAALMLSRLAGVPVRQLLMSHPEMNADLLNHLVAVTQSAQTRHQDVIDPVEVLAAFGGFEIAMMVGAILVAASRRHLIMIDGLPACAALMVAARIAAPVTDYCVFCRSHSHQGLDAALELFHTTALLELGMESSDGTGATLAWPLVRAAAALLSEVTEGEDPGPSRPGALETRAGSSGAR
jgi:nicotinate-nucleotide--dimethylbenzimidazole phosphoribosyltransferase